MSLRPTLAPALLIGASLLTACSRHEADPRSGPPLVRTAVAAATGTGNREFTGVVSARVQSDLGFRVPGKITARLVDTGQLVRRGQPLMRIDPTDLTLATTAERGSVEAAQARASQTAADERRYRDLVSAGAVSASAYDQARAAADAARAQLRAAQAQAQVARNQAGYSVLVADADGVVVETLAEPGQVVGSGQTVVRLAHAGAREAVVDLPETLRPRTGSTATATLFDKPGESVPARLRQLSDAADPQTRTFQARYVLDRGAARAPLGSTVTLSLPDPSGQQGLRVPLAALHDFGRGAGVWIVRPRTSTVSWRPVRLQGLGDEYATLSDGIRGGERFVALGAHLLHEGQQVRIAPNAGQAR